MPVNAGYEYFNAEKKYLAAKTVDEKIMYLEEMIKAAPKHKSSENFVSELKNRLRRFLEKKEKSKKVGKSSIKGVKKEGYQCVLVGLPNTGKSSLLSKLTNARPLISPYPFSTAHPELGTMNYEGVKVQIVDLPGISSEYFDSGTANTANLIIIVVDNLDQISGIDQYLTKANGKKIIVINKSDLLSYEQKRKLQETIKSKKLNGVLISAETGDGIPTLKEKILQTMNIIRAYTKEPGKKYSPLPIVLPIGSTVRDVAESILKGFSKKVKETRLTGPSGKFPNQKVGLSHILRDKDIVEFHTN